jgi:hypothetical protein
MVDVFAHAPRESNVSARNRGSRVKPSGQERGNLCGAARDATLGIKNAAESVATSNKLGALTD